MKYIKFQSFSEDSPLLEITTKEAFCTYKYKSKYIRFINPDIDIINSIKETLKTIKLENNINQLQAA